MSHDATDPGNATIEAIDWDHIDDGDPVALVRSDILAGASILAYLAGWIAIHLARGSGARLVDREITLFVPHIGVLPLRPVQLHLALAPTNVDYLMGLTLLTMFWWGVVPLARRPSLAARYWRDITRNTAAVVSFWFLTLTLFIGLVGPLIVGHPETDFSAAHLPPVGAGGTWAHPLGTTSRGEGILEIVIAGMRVSMQVGLIATLIIIILAAIVGTTAAFSGGWVDEVLMRFVDVLMTFPTFFLILFLIFIYGESLFLLILILGFTGWGGVCRLVRSEALQRTEETYIDAAIAAGASRWFIVRRHLLPNVSNTVITAATLAIPFLILTEAVIAFLGFGDPAVWSWGRIIARGRSQLASAWWVATIPGIFLFATVLAFNFLGDALRDAIDPRHELR